MAPPPRWRNLLPRTGSSSPNSPAPPTPPYWVARLAPPHQSIPNQSPGANLQNRAPTPSAPVDDADIATITKSMVEEDNAHQDATEISYISAWDRAVAALRGKKSDNLRILEKNLAGLDNRSSLADDIGQMLEERYEKIRAKDGVSQSHTRKLFSHTAKIVLSTKDLGRGLGRLDPSGIAPVVLGGVYCLAQCISEATEGALAAIQVTMDIAETFALWNCLEERQIKKQHNQQLKVLYQDLSGAIARMFEVAIVLLGTLMKYFDSKWQKTMDVLDLKRSEWEKLKVELTTRESMCKSIQSEITIEEKGQERTSEVLKWVSPHDSNKSYKTVQNRTKMDELYRDRCQWLIEEPVFESWYSLQATPVLWLNGTIGTGKTTLMVRAIQEIERSSMVEIEAKPFAKFFFEKAHSSSDSLLSVETCLRSLVRQLSWNHATSSIELVTEKKYEFKDDLVDDSSLSTGDCLQLLKDLISDKEAYIMIDAIDECNDATSLLETLKELMLLLDKRKEQHGFLHLMLCGRSHLPVSDYFEQCFRITTNSVDSLDDQYFFVDKEIDRIKKIKSGSLFVTSGENFPDRLSEILKKKAKGLFRWIEIKIEFFRKHRFVDTKEIEEQLDQLETSTKDPELDDEYKKLLGLLSARQRTRAMSLLKFIACSFWRLSADSLAQAITTHEFGTGNQEVTADDVRRLLVGFVSEVPKENKSTNEDKSPNEVKSASETAGPVDGLNFLMSTINRRMPSVIETYTDDGDDFVLELGHTSVLEYLMESTDNTAAADDFTTPAQHSEAASLCFASTLHRQRLDSASNSPSVLQSENVQLDDYRKSMSDLFYYSCHHWPEHCRIAFTGNNTTLLIESTLRFILNDSYLIWNSAFRGIQRRILDPDVKRKENNIWHDPQLRRPGFVIAVYNLTQLLEFPAIQASQPSTLRRMLQLVPGPVRWNGDIRALASALVSNSPESIEAVLNPQEDDTSYTGSVLGRSVFRFGSWESRALEREDRILMIQFIKELLASGRNMSNVLEE